MTKVNIKGIKLNANHGVLESEKLTPQEFLIDITYFYDGDKASSCDDICAAVDYAAVGKLAYDICAGNSFALLEKLSRTISRAIADRFPAISMVEVCVHKPNAPMGLPFGDVTVTSVTERKQVILSLGSSLGDKKATLDGAIACLSETDGLEVKRVSDYIVTPPYGGAAEEEFLNCALIADCLLSPRELLESIHSVENRFGRVRTKRWGDRTLDIDIIFFGDMIIAEEGLCIPHPDYKNRDFVLRPLKQIAPDFVCPLTHLRIADM